MSVLLKLFRGTGVIACRFYQCGQIGRETPEGMALPDGFAKFPKSSHVFSYEMSDICTWTKSTEEEGQKQSSVETKRLFRYVWTPLWIRDGTVTLHIEPRPLTAGHKQFLLSSQT
jgi:hypothetical protein